ncbi:hypothetical protein ACFFGH_16240 [Lysobacter korlensis]|uniref:DUF308 domain-containing protein n=1 Tax=Lysobacter korlensis TaxID=553636 RepID=A0ABV6RQZ5_9GAMM
MAGSGRRHDARRTNRWGKVIWGGAVLLLMLPAVAMQFTNEVNWDETDFIVVGMLLAAACGIYELGARLSRNTWYRAAFGVAIVTAFMLVWLNLAVGVIGNEDNPANLFFGGVLAIAIVGALLVRFRAHGMARVFDLTAIAQAAMAAYALFAGPYVKGAVLSLLFAMAWLVAARLFRIAGRQQGAA